jgi:hypothetical protein
VSNFAYLPIRRGSKKPAVKGWNKPEAAIYDKSQLHGGNIGLALAYCNPVLCSLDIDHLPSAKPTLENIGLNPEEIDATRIKSGRENSLKLLFKLPGEVTPLKTVVIKDGNRVSFELRSANSAGNTVCEVIPPSVHPSGSTYCWDGIRDLDSVTEIPKELLNYWLSRIKAEKAKKHATVRASLSDFACDSPRDEALLRKLLSYINPNCDRATWLEVIFSTLSTGLTNAVSIAQDWSEGSSDQFNLNDFNSTINSYRAGHYSTGTLYYYAKLGGYLGSKK